ncbi:hypothetical protein BP6252_08129 [Coleophoma cylindrospora]|uniref:Peptidase M3A/M3B catalytic domain-containing protein n=1 Tax=Coleophoma cylindrospora TaxID=1849047 RepID=A0A3D8RC86_9HELO|nr:hypothetical protein BP6252_08129 [Coleophoma cylindrospora]
MAQNKEKKLPQAAILFNATATSILDEAKGLIERVRKAQDQIVESIQPETATFGNTLLPLAQAENNQCSTSSILTFYANVSPDEDLRHASTQAKNLLKEFDIESNMREDVFILVDAVFQKNEHLDPESKRLLQEKHRGFIKNGLALPATKRHRFEELHKRISQLKIEFQKNLNEEDGSIWFTQNELAGVPDSVLSGMEKVKDGNEDKVRLKFNYSEYLPVMRYALSCDTRKRYYISFFNRCNQNVPILKEIIVLRDEAARLLGFSNHAEFRLQDRMAKRPEVVNSLLDDLRSKLTTGGGEETENLKQFKKADVESQGEVFDGHFYLWDYTFYTQVMVEKDYSIDAKQVSEFFSLEVTTQRMLRAFENLFGLVFIEINEDDKVELVGNGMASKLIWHEDVSMYSVWDEESEGGEFCGYLYMDLHSRKGKYGNPSTWSIQQGFVGPDGQRRYPAAALVCTFPKPTPTKPSLLEHQDVVMMFHELGHGIHELVSKTTYARFHGTAVVEDFCETPSIMLEQFCWTSALKDFSQHYSTLSPEYRKAWESDQTSAAVNSSSISDQISDQTIQDLIRTKGANKSLYYLRQLHIAIFDMTIHQPESHDIAKAMDISEVYNSLLTELISEGPQGLGHQWAHGEATIPHLVGTYDVGFYGYVTAAIYALDMFDQFFRSDPWNAQQGRRYRRMILEPGASQEEMKTLVDYLGREPLMDAFYKELGLV